MNDALMIKRAETMIAWYRELEEHATTKRDHEVAVTLHAVAPEEHWVDHGNPNGNAALVRRVRRWVDHQHEGEFGQYSFGTKRSGSGRTYSHLNTPEARLLSATIGTSSQIQASEQRVRTEGELRGRESMKYNANSEEWHQLGDFQRCIACRDAANDIEQFGYFRPATRQALIRLGLI